MTALYSLGDAPSKKLVPRTQMRFGSVAPAVEAMEYVRRREDAGDFSVVGFVQSATRQIVAEVSVPGHDEHHMLSVPLSGVALGYSDVRQGIPIKVSGQWAGRNGEGVLWVPENKITKYMSPTEESILDFGHPDLPERYNIYQVLMPSWNAYMQTMGAR